MSVESKAPSRFSRRSSNYPGSYFATSHDSSELDEAIRLAAAADPMEVDLIANRRLSAVWNDFLRGSEEKASSTAARSGTLPQVQEEEVEEANADLEAESSAAAGASQSKPRKNGVAAQDAHSTSWQRTHGGTGITASKGIIFKETSSAHAGVDLSSALEARIVAELSVSNDISSFASSHTLPPRTRVTRNSLLTAPNTMLFQAAGTGSLAPSVRATTLPSFDSLITIAKASAPLPKKTIHDRRTARLPALAVERSSARSTFPAKEAAISPPTSIFVAAPSVSAGSSESPIRKVLKSEKPAGYTPRPPNAWILYRSEQIRVLKQDTLSSTVKKPQSDISKYIALMWRDEVTSVRQWYETQAEIKKQEHRELHPDYRFAPVRKTRGEGSSTEDPEGALSKKSPKKAKAPPKPRPKASIRPHSSSSPSTRTKRSHTEMYADEELDLMPSLVSFTRSLSPAAASGLPILFTSPSSNRPRTASSTLPFIAPPLSISQMEGVPQYQYAESFLARNDFVPIEAGAGTFFFPLPSLNVVGSDSVSHLISSEASAEIVTAMEAEYDLEVVQEATYPTNKQFFSASRAIELDQHAWMSSSSSGGGAGYDGSTKRWYSDSDGASSGFVTTPASAIYDVQQQQQLQELSIVEPSSASSSSSNFRRQQQQLTSGRSILEQPEAQGGASSSYSFGTHPKHWNSTPSQREANTAHGKEFQAAFGNQWRTGSGQVEFLELEYATSPSSAGFRRRASESFAQQVSDAPRRMRISTAIPVPRRL